LCVSLHESGATLYPWSGFETEIGEDIGKGFTINVPLPTTYGETGLQPSGETESGWWKIRYNMNGTGTSNDVTTWKVSIRGNPVHLKVP
jgi:hypothetical protein